MYKIATESADRLGIYIDNSNLWCGSGFDRANSMLDYRGLIEQLTEGRIPLFCKIYGSYEHKTVDGNRIIDYDLRDCLSRMGFDTHFKDSYDEINNVQKQVDSMIVSDIVEDVVENKIDTVLLVSGDGDMIPAIEKARSRGKNIEIASFDHCISRELRNLGRYIPMDDMLLGVDKGNNSQKGAAY